MIGLLIFAHVFRVLAFQFELCSQNRPGKNENLLLGEQLAQK